MFESYNQSFSSYDCDKCNEPNSDIFPTILHDKLGHQWKL